MSNEAVCRTAPATPGLSTIYTIPGGAGGPRLPDCSRSYLEEDRAHSEIKVNLIAHT